MVRAKGTDRAASQIATAGAFGAGEASDDVTDTV